MNELQEMLLRKQCEFGNIVFEDINFESDTWFMEHTWTKEQEQKFFEWFTKALKNDKKLRRKVMKYPTSNMGTIKRTVNAYLSNYSFKYSDE